MRCAGLRYVTWEVRARDCLNHRWRDIILHGGGVDARGGDGIPYHVLNATGIQGNRNIAIGCRARWCHRHRVDMRRPISQTRFTDSRSRRARPCGTDIRCGESIGTGAECLREVKRYVERCVRALRSAGNHCRCGDIRGSGIKTDSP